jgi:predicted MFS family arabinose efflux permease
MASNQLSVTARNGSLQSGDASTNGVPIHMPADVSVRSKWAVVVLFGIGTLGPLVLPVAVGALARHGVNGKLLGILGFTEFSASALGSFLSAFLLPRTSAWVLGAAGATLSVAGGLIAGLAAANRLELLITARLMAGFGGGLILSSALAEGARIGLGTSGYGWMMATTALLSAVSYLMAPALIDVAEGRGVFFVAAVLSLLALPALWALGLERRQSPGSGRDLPFSPHSVSRPSTAPTRIILISSATFFLYAIGENALWTFAVPLGEHAGLEFVSISHLFVFVMVAGCIPPLLAARFVRVTGLGRSIVICTCALVLWNLLLVTLNQAWSFSVFVSLRLLSQALACPLYLSLFARADPSGRAAAAASGALNVGVALGPLVAGYVVNLEAHDFTRVAATSILAYCSCLSFAYVLICNLPDYRKQTSALA